MPLLEVEDLRVHYPGGVRAVDGVSFLLEQGETYALVGESGCGKTATGLALLRLVEPGQVVGGRVRFEGRDLLALTEKEMRGVRGARIGMVFQEPAAALDPVMRIGSQVAESLRVHKRLGRRAAQQEAVRLLEVVALPDAAQQARVYPHELSGGMMQRVMLAIALSCSPSLLIADEPTTALDVTIQAQILALLRRLKREFRLTVLLITHDLGVVAENADRVGVMYAGQIVEQASARALFERPAHPYTRGLLHSMPGGDGARRDHRLPTLRGGVPDASDPPPGCRFHPRCPQRFAPCDGTEPVGRSIDAAEAPTSLEHTVACLLYDERYAPSGAEATPPRDGTS
jgi:oligopeptide/dipeptide ABC transporter ATP-binding protein